MKQTLQKAFTIVEILVVVVILGIISALVLLAINPAKKINLSKDARVKSDISQIVNSLQTYYANPLSDAKYPSAPDGLDTLIQSGELKSLPNQQEGFVSCPATPGGITTGTTYCYVVSEESEDKVIAVWGTLFSKGLLAWCWDSTTGTFTEKKEGETLPTAENPSCQIALPTSTPMLPINTPTVTPTPTNCPTAGICQTGGGRVSGTCVPVVPALVGTDPKNNCVSARSCSGSNVVGTSGNCNGSGACETAIVLLETCQTFTNPTNNPCMTTGGCTAEGTNGTFAYCKQQYIQAGIKGTIGCNTPCRQCNGSGVCENVPWGKDTCTQFHYGCAGHGYCEKAIYTQPCNYYGVATYTNCANACASTSIYGDNPCYGGYFEGNSSGGTACGGHQFATCNEPAFYCSCGAYYFN